MPRIREYTQQTTVSSEVGGRRATAEDFGYGAQMQQFGETLQKVGFDIREDADRRELEDASVKVAQSRQQWTETYLQRKQSMQPGDMSMAAQTRDEMNDYFSSMADNYTSDKAKKYVRMHGTTMSTEFFASGLQYQQVQAGQKARADHSVRIDTGSNVAYSDPTQYGAVVGTLEFDIKNGVGAYAYLQNAPDKDKLLQDAKEKIAWSASMKAAEDPRMRAVLLGKMGAGRRMSEEEVAKQAFKMDAEGVSSQEIANFMKSAMPAADIEYKGKDGIVARGALDTSDLPQYVRDLTPQAQQQLVQKMMSYQREEDRVAQAALKQRVENDMAYMSLTGQAPQNKLTPLDFKNNTDGWQAYSAAVKATETLTGVWSVPYNDGLKTVEALQPQAGDPNYADKAKVYVEARRMFDARWKEIAKDNIAADQQAKFAPGTGGMTPITVDQPQKWVAELLTRTPQARASSSTRNLPYGRILSDGEAKVMGDRFIQMPMEEQKTLLARIGTNFQNDKDTIAVLMGQLAQGKQGIMAVGNLMYAYPGTSQNGEERDQVAENLLLGTKLLHRPKGGADDNERSAYRTQMPKEEEAVKAITSMSQFKQVSLEFTAALPQVTEAIMAHYVGKMSKKGVSNMSIKDNMSEFEASAKTILGTPEKIGASSVIVPWGMKNSDFAEAVRQRVPAQWGTYSLRHPVNAPPTVFEVIQGNMPVGMINIDKPVPESMKRPAAGAPVVTQTDKALPFPAQFQGVKTYEERTGKGIYDDTFITKALQ